MKVREQLREHLIENGLFDSEADAVLALTATSPLFPNKEVLDRPAGGYDKATLVTMILSINLLTTHWMDENAPHHWARGNFDDKLS